MRHLVWDWNGTLFDDLPLIVESVNAALEALGAPPVDAGVYRDRFRRPVVRFYEWMLDREVSADEERLIDDRFFDHYHAGLARVGLAAEALDAVRAAETAGATQSILSMWWHDRLGPAVERLGLAPWMILVDGLQGPAGHSKADPLRAHLARLNGSVAGLTAADVVVIGDVADDARAAAEVGASCVLYDGGSQSRAVLERTGCPVVSSLIEAVGIAVGGPRR